MPTALRPCFKVFTGTFESPDTTGAGSGSQPTQWTHAENMQVLFISSTCNGEIGEARIKQQPGLDYETDFIRNNTPVKIVATHYYNGVMQEDKTVFEGILVKCTDIQGGEEYQREYIAYNRGDDFLRRKILEEQIWCTYDTFNQVYDDPSLVLAIDTSDRSNFLVAFKPVIFNPQGKYNCMNQRFVNTSNQDFWLFDQEDRRNINADGTEIYSIPWTIRRALCYLREFFQVGWAINPLGWSDARLQVLFGSYQTFDADGKTTSSDDTAIRDYTLYNLNLTGRSLAVCLRELLEPHGYGFHISPYADYQDKHSITLFRRSDLYSMTGVTATNLVIEAGDLNVDGDTPNVLNFNITEDSTSVVNCLTYLGAHQVVTTLATSEDLDTFPTDFTAAPKLPGQIHGLLPLVPGFSTIDLARIALANLPPNVFMSSLIYDDGVDKIFAPGRIWIVNTGESSEQYVYDLNELFVNDGSAIGVDEEPDGWSAGDMVNDKKKFEMPEYYTTGTSAKEYNQVPIQVEGSTDSGVNWFSIEKSKYDVLSNSMGIVFTEDALDDIGADADFPAGVAQPLSYWDALRTGTLRLRVLCSFKSDQRLGWFIVDTSATKGPLQTEALLENLGYNRFYESNALRSQSSISYTDYKPIVNVVDDVKKLTGNSITTLQANSLPTYTGSIVLLARLDIQDAVWQMFQDFAPGKVVSTIFDRRDFSSNPPVIIRGVLDCLNWHYQIYVNNDNELSPLRGTDEAFVGQAIKYAQKVPGQ